MREYLELQSPGTSTTYSFKRIMYLDYEILCLEQVHLMFVCDASNKMMYYLPLTPTEYTILLQLLCYPDQETVPFRELLPDENQDLPLQIILISIRRHMCRLKKKLPPCWKIVSEPGFGYRLRVIKRADGRGHLRSEPIKDQDCSSSSSEREK